MWQLNVINIHVLFEEATETFLEHLMEAYRQLAMMGPTVSIGDFNAVPSVDDRGGRQTPEDTAVQMAMQHIGLKDLRASLKGQLSHRPPQPGSADSRIHLCYADPAYEVTRARYQDLLSNNTGHRPQDLQIKVLQVPPSSTEDMDHDEQPPIRRPDEHGRQRRMVITARCCASWANKTRRTSTLPCDKRPRRAASTEDTGAHKTKPPRIRTYDPWLLPYGATSGHYIQRYSPMTRRPS